MSLRRDRLMLLLPVTAQSCSSTRSQCEKWTDHLLTYCLCLSFFPSSQWVSMGEVVSLRSWLAPEAVLPTASTSTPPHIQRHHGGGSPNALHHSGLRHFCFAVGGLSWHRPLLCLLRRAPAHNAGRLGSSDRKKNYFPFLSWHYFPSL